MVFEFEHRVDEAVGVLGADLGDRFLRWTGRVHAAAGGRAAAEQQVKRMIEDAAARLKTIKEELGLAGVRAEIERLQELESETVAQINAIRVADIQAEARTHEQRLQAAAEAEAARLDPAAAMRALEERFDLRLRVSADGKLEAAPAGRARHYIVKAIMARHRAGLIALIKLRDEWVEV